MKTIILFYQHISREMFSINKLKDSLESSGNKVFVFSIDFELFDAYRIAKRMKVDLVVTPWIYHDMNYKLFVPFIEENPQVKIINTHQEQLPSKMSEPIVMPLPGVSSDCCYHLAWGEFFKKKLVENGVPEKLVYITGNMRNDEMLYSENKREKLAKEYCLDTYKKWILYAETRDFIYAWTKEAKYEFLCKGIPEKEIDEFYNISKESLEMTKKDIDSLPDSFFDKYELIYRPHPGCRDYPINARCKQIADYSIYEWLKAIDIFVTWTSTSALEADALNVPVLINEPIPNVPDQRMECLDAYPVIKTLSEIEICDVEAILEKQKQRKAYVRYFGEIDGKAVERVSKTIMTIGSIYDDGYEAKIINYKDKNWNQRRIYMLVLKTVIKLGLFDKLKYPHSAYAHRNDIPFYAKRKQ